MQNRVELLIVRFKNQIRKYELPFFRGAVISTIESEDAVLFHNHIGNGYRYSYPLIQYKCISGQGAIVCIKSGTEEIGAFFSHFTPRLSIGNRIVEAEIDSVKAYNILVQVWDSCFDYTIHSWMPLNAENYQKYMQIEEVISRVQFLEKILVGNILSFCKGINVTVNDEITCKILHMDTPRIEKYKDTKMMTFNVTFRTNISLPNYIGLGKGASLGMGVVICKKNFKDNNNE